jgi:hypothetical protein
MITHANKTAWPDALALSTTLLSFLNLEMDWLLKVGENATQSVSWHHVSVGQGYNAVPPYKVVQSLLQGNVANRPLITCCGDPAETRLRVSARGSGHAIIGQRGGEMVMEVEEAAGLINSIGTFKS